MGLEGYRAKRDFARTSEPRGGGDPAAAGARRFVVQRHRARRLHYDFRLEIDGVLVSWAVPKGVTLDPAARHLAVHVEDHPIEYLDFEGVIPAGEYGAGDVVVWDRGTWEPHHADDPAAAVEAGELHVDLHGEKLSGRVVLVRTRPDTTGSGSGRGDDWLVLHKRDEHAVEGWDPEAHPRSVLSGRTNDEVAADPDRIWTSGGERLLHEPLPDLPAATADELGALASLGTRGTWTVGGRELALTNLDKVLFPPAGVDATPVTKRDLIAYYTQIAPVLLPHLVDRPLNLNRYPDGVEAAGFWQKQAPAYAPEWIPRWHNPGAEAGESREYLVADSVAALAWLANHAAIELHPWTSRTTDAARPTYALFDIDPGTGTPWADVVMLARLHRTALEHLSVRGYPKVTGRRGIQVWVPIVAGPSFSDTRLWVEGVSHAIGAVAGDVVSWSWHKADRGGRARLDFTQNARNKTLVAPYSARAAPGAPVSAPIDWDELDDPALAPDRWTIRTILDRVAARGDPMAEMLVRPQVLPKLE
ncbi:MAG: non-homologous end-joining DNA ligase [Acidimicrobiia bacterium]